MKRFIIILVSMIPIMNITLYAQSEWFGKWWSDPVIGGTERMVMEYDFKNETELSLSFYTYNQVPGEGRCISKITVDGEYSYLGPLFFVSMDQRSLDVSLLRFQPFKKNRSSSMERQILQQMEASARPLFEDFQDVMMVYVTHDDPDTISFILGEGDNATEMMLHRPTESIEKIFDWEDKSDAQSIMSDNSRSSSPMGRMWKSFGLFMLYVVLSFVSILGVKILFRLRISRKNTAAQSVFIRKLYSIVRFMLRIAVIAVGLVLWVRLLIDSMALNKFMGMIALCSGGGLMLYLFSSLSLPMSFMTMPRFLSEERFFILYLRGFLTDSYSSEMERHAEIVSDAKPWMMYSNSSKTKESPNSFPMNEKSMAKAWKKYYPVYSVGLPEELESPEGCRRIYLDNDCWQENVLTLMHLAEYILVRIHPNDNCIWEIQQCDTYYSEKTIYYVDSFKLLKAVREKMGDDLPACLKDESITHSHMIVYQKDGETVVRAYANTDLGQLNAVRDCFARISR